MKDDTLLLNIDKLLPRFLDIPGSWVGHTPFAAWLIAELTPACLVELGTHSANSYFAFCESVVNNGLETRCFAVDTWAGDSQASFYSEAVYERVARINEEEYAPFSTLLRCTFDDALEQFGERSIELLHIDGLHTFEAVSHDFTSWLPKLAPGAVVLFHDIEARHDDFGVYTLWEDLCRTYQFTFSFEHSWGLGVLQIPPQKGEKPLKLFTDTGERDRIHAFFTALGGVVQDGFDWREKILTAETQLAETVREKEEYFEQREHFRHECKRLEELVTELTRQRDLHLSERNHFIKESENSRRQCAQLLAEREQAQQQLALLPELRRQLAAATRRYEEIEADLWWKIGIPLRRLTARKRTDEA